NYLEHAARPDEAEPHARRALDVLERRWGPNHVYLAHVHEAMGRIALRRGNLDVALRETERALDILAKNSVGAFNQTSIKVGYCRVLLRLHRWHQAAVVARQVVTTREASLAGSPLLVAEGQELLGLALMGERHWTEAEGEFIQAHQRMVQVVGPSHEYSL